MACTRQLLHVSRSERDEARQELVEIAGQDAERIVICHPGSGGREKCCPLVTLRSMLQKRGEEGETILWMIGPTELEWHGEAFADELACNHAVIYEESLLKAAYLLCGADAFIGNDAGMTHLAAALGLDTIALFGPTCPDVWRPLGPGVTVIRFLATSESRQST
jgi:ADP-heptose:LPS heptosyltransferase